MVSEVASYRSLKKIIMWLKLTSRNHALFFSISNLYCLPATSAYSSASRRTPSRRKQHHPEKAGQILLDCFHCHLYLGVVSGVYCSVSSSGTLYLFLSANIMPPQNIDWAQYFLSCQSEQCVDHSHFRFVITCNALTLFYVSL